MSHGFTLTPFESRRYEAPRGPATLERSFPTTEFWRAWRSAKDSLRSLGYSVTKELDGRWVVERHRYIENTNTPPEAANGYSIRDTRGLLPYQVPHAGSLCAALHKFGSALDASDTGTGKSFSAIATSREMGFRPVIVCPKSVIYAWARVCEHFKVVPLFIANWEACKSKEFRQGHEQADGSYKWFLPPGTLIIFDEAHKAKGEYTMNGKMVIAAKRQSYRILLLSATIASTPREMRAMGYALGMHNLSDFNAWAKGYGCYQNQFEGWECAEPREAMKKISAELFPAKGSRIAIRDLGDAFPETQITADLYDIGDFEKKQNEKYTELLREIERLKDSKKEGVQAAIMTLNLRYRQVTEGYKVDLFVDMAKEYIESGMSVAIFVNFTDTLQEIKAKLKCPSVDGTQDAKTRDNAVQKFQSGVARAIALNIRAGGVGLSLHDETGDFPRVALVSPTYSAIDLKQVLGRVNRAGGKSKSLQRILYAKGTVEEGVCKRVNDRLANISALNDGDLMEPDLLGMLGKEEIAEEVTL